MRKNVRFMISAVLSLLLMGFYVCNFHNPAADIQFYVHRSCLSLHRESFCAKLLPIRILWKVFHTLGCFWLTLYRTRKSKIWRKPLKGQSLKKSYSSLKNAKEWTVEIRRLAKCKRVMQIRKER